MISQIGRLFSAFIPKKIIDTKVKELLNYAGSKDDPRQWVGIRVLVATLVGIIMLLVPQSVFPLINMLFNTKIFFDDLLLPLVTLGMAIGGFLAAIALFYLHVGYVVDGRKKMVENILPDFLFLVGNNLKSGMAPFYAFRSAIRPEFGPLSEEIKIATQKSLGVESFSDALKNIGARIDSKILADTTKFFAQALKSGGHLAQLIETTATDIKQTNKLKKELITSTRMYTLFILFVVVVASPMLLSVGVQFLTILSGIQAKTGIGSSGSTELAGTQNMINMSAITITPEFMTNMGFALIVVNSILASVFIGVLGGGKIKEGLKYAPLMAGAGIVLFIIFINIIGGLVAGLAK